MMITQHITTIIKNITMTVAPPRSITPSYPPNLPKLVTQRQRRTGEPVCPPAWRGIERHMELPLLLIIIGIIVAVLVSYAIGIVCILVGLVLLVWPRLRASV
jgi:hypothetical protein